MAVRDWKNPMRKKLLITMVSLVTIVSIFVYLESPFQPILDIKIHRFLHILGAILFLGNIITGAMWMIITDISKSPTIFRFSIRAINIADILFTAPGALLLMLNGGVLSNQWGGLWNQPWLIWSLIIFAFIGILWTTILAPLQLHFEKISEDSLSFESLHKTWRFRRILIFYFVFGAITASAAVVILLLMIFK